MSPMEPLKTYLNAVNASVTDQTSEWFALNGVDEISVSLEGTTPTVDFQNNLVFDTSTNAPKSDTWYTVETMSAVGVHNFSIRTKYGRFKATDGNPVTVKAVRLVDAAAPHI